MHDGMCVTSQTKRVAANDGTILGTGERRTAEINLFVTWQMACDRWQANVIGHRKPAKCCEIRWKSGVLSLKMR